MELVQKHIPATGYAGMDSPIGITLNAGHNTIEQRYVVLRYILLNGHTLELSQFVHQLSEQSPEHENMLITIAELLEQKGIEQGWEEGS
ncbi:transposase (fragment) [Xenorhabdus szentirmaii DSM 16338]|uniref:Transposase n=1 Tax=Xenorhabdus szentirmaii DSM 16338 TaxID=1427518 RepID=W1IRA1_9GAMM